jgi:hypothetical protein
MLLILFTALTIPNTVFAGVYASGIHFTNPDSTAFDGSVTDGTGLRINFVLNDTASAVEIRIQNSVTNAVIRTLNLANRAHGWNNTIWDGTGAPAGTASYYVTIIASRAPRSSTAYRLAQWTNTTATGFGIFSRGVDVVRDQTNRNFGFFYTSNAGLPIGRGIARYTASGGHAGTAQPNPFLTQSGVNTNGIPWSDQPSAPVHATIDHLGRVYASDFPLGQVWRMDNNTAVPKRVIPRVFEPKGIAITGSGSTLKLYIASGGLVVRANIGTNDTLAAPLDTIADLGGSVRDVIFDDQGFMYVNQRNGTGFEGTAGGKTFRFNITGPLPVTEFDALWSVEWTGFPIGIAHWSGANSTTATDDIMYVSQRSGGTADLPGVYNITALTGTAPVRTHLFRPSDVPGGGGGDCSSRADLTVDPTGNIVFFENGNEEIIHIEPPSTQPTVSYTTRSAVTFTLGPSSVELVPGLPERYELKQNYPNPFNPTTTIEFSLRQSGFVSLKVYDVLGREVATLANEQMSAGNYRATFDAQNLPSGTYIYALRTNGFSQAKRFVVVK